MAEVTQGAIVEKADRYVFDAIKSAQANKLTYHNYKHTHDVVKACQEIGEGVKLNDSEQEVIALAAWFHDLGYIEGYESHEEVSVKQAKAFLVGENYPAEKIEQVVGCIHATKMPQTPTNALEEVLCDADLSSLGQSSYRENSRLLRTELELNENKTFSNEAWLKEELQLLTTHHFHTRWAHLKYGEGKAKNIVKCQSELSKTVRKEEDLRVKKEKADIPQRGIETMFRTIARTHIDLSAIADNKANIMLTINAIILTFSLPYLVPKFAAYPELILPTGVMLIVSLSAIVFAILSAMPNVPNGVFTKEDIKNREANLLFFGNIHSMKLEEFEEGITEMMNDRDFLYKSMVRDFHSLGKVLSKKYKYLTYCYNIFMYGMIISVILFGIQLALNR